jgi:hypothetical protein
MPHKNVRCCGWKTKFFRWVEDTGDIQPFSTWHVWKYETKCPICGRIHISWRARRPSPSALKVDNSQKELKE